ALYLVPPPEDRLPWRRSMFVQGCALAAVFAVFVLDRLPAIALASQRFGEPLSSVRDMTEWVVHAIRFLFPSWVWLGLLAGGSAGTVLMGLGRKYRAFAFLVGLVLLVDSVHFALTKRCPYPRVCGYFLPLVVVGAAHLLQRGMLAVQNGWWSIPVLGALAALLIGPGSATRESIAPIDSGVGDGVPPGGVYAVVADFDYVVTKHLPTRWLSHQDSFSPEEIRFLALVGEPDADPHVTAWRVGSAMAPSTRTVPQGGTTVVGMDHRSMTLFPAHGVESSPSNGLPESEIVIAVWHLEQGRVGLDPAPLMKLFDD